MKSLPDPLLDRFTTSEPSAFITYTSQSPVRVDWNAIWVPSGDQCGTASLAPSVVNCVTPEPSAFITKTSRLPDRVDWKAILAPFGDHAGA